MPLVAGVDLSTQACKIVIRDSDTGALLRSGRARNPDGTEVDPNAWWTAFESAAEQAGGLDDVAAIAVGGQQHGMVCLDEAGEVVRPALLWNDTRSAPDAADLVSELGAQYWAGAVGSVPVASFTVTKLRWLRRAEPANADRTVAVCLPHDWLTWKLSGSTRLEDLVTDRGDASGTGYWSPFDNAYRDDLVERALGFVPRLPRVLGPHEPAGRTPSGAVLGPGTGDNAGAALGLEVGAGDAVISIGTSGVVSTISPTPSADPSGLVAGFASATGDFLPLACTLNGARVLDATAGLLGVDHAELDRLALAAAPGAGGLVLVPYLEGERTPNLPDAQGALHGVTLTNLTPQHMARATVEGLVCLLADAVDALTAQGVAINRFFLVGGAARSGAVQQVAAAVLGQNVLVPEPGEYVADGAARQAAWVLSGGDDAPAWSKAATVEVSAEPTPQVRERYAEVRSMTIR